MKYIDLTHLFKSKMPVFPGDDAPVLKQVAWVGKDDCAAFRVDTGMHIGTHMDAPSHMIEGAKGLAEYPVEHFVGPGILLDARGRDVIDVDLLESFSGDDDLKGAIVLVLTGLGKDFEEPHYYESYPEISQAFAHELVRRGVKIVGTDTPSPDRHPYAVHKILLGADVLILENLCNLEALLGAGVVAEAGGFKIMALPTKFEAEAAHVRVVAEVA